MRLGNYCTFAFVPCHPITRLTAIFKSSSFEGSLKTYRVHSTFKLTNGSFHIFALQRAEDEIDHLVQESATNGREQEQVREPHISRGLGELMLKTFS